MDVIVVGADEMSKECEVAVEQLCKHYRGRTKEVKLVTSIAYESLKLAEILQENLGCRLIVDSNWDVPKTEVNVSKYNLSNSSELFDFCKSLNAQLLHFDLNSYFEPASAYPSRLLSALATPGLLIAITSQIVVADCIKLAEGKELIDGAAAIAARIERNQSYDSWQVTQIWTHEDDVIAYVQTLPMLNLYETQTDAKEEFKLAPVDFQIKARVPKLVDAEMLMDIKKFQRELMECFISVPGRDTACEQIQQRIMTALAALDERLTETIYHMNGQFESISSCLASLSSELISVSTDIHFVSDLHIQFNQLLRSFAARLDAGLRHLTQQLEDSEAALAREQTALRSMPVRAQKKSPPFQIMDLSVRVDAVIVARVRCRKQYQIPAFVSITKGTEVAFFVPFDGGYDSEAQLGSMAKYPPGDYAVTIQDQFGSLLSNVYPLPIDESVSIPRVSGRMVEVADGRKEGLEVNIREIAGESGVECFRRLAEEWGKNDGTRYEQFVEICVRSVGNGENAVRSSLEHAGFRLN